MIALVALTALAISTWLWSRQGVEDGTPQVTVNSDALGYYLRDAAILGTDVDGSALFRIQAASAEEMPGERRLLLSDVAVAYQPAAEVPWALTAARGEAFLEESYLDFSGEVELIRIPRAATGPTVIRTESLRLEPESFDVHTAGPVSLFFGGSRLDAVGLSANLKAERLALESSVHGEFDP